MILMLNGENAMILKELKLILDEHQCKLVK